MKAKYMSGFAMRREARRTCTNPKRHQWDDTAPNKSKCRNCNIERVKLSVAKTTLYYNVDGYYLGTRAPECF